MDRCCTGALKKAAAMADVWGFACRVAKWSDQSGRVLPPGRDKFLGGLSQFGAPSTQPHPVFGGINFQTATLFFLLLFFLNNRQGWINARRKCLEAKTLQLWQKKAISTQNLDSPAESQVTSEWTFPLGGFTPHHTSAQRALFLPHFDIPKRKSQPSACCCSTLKSLCHFGLSTNRSRPLTSEAQNSPFLECFIVTGNFIIEAAPCSFFFYL